MLLNMIQMPHKEQKYSSDVWLLHTLWDSSSY